MKELINRIANLLHFTDPEYDLWAVTIYSDGMCWLGRVGGPPLGPRLTPTELLEQLRGLEEAVKRVHPNANV